MNVRAYRGHLPQIAASAYIDISAAVIGQVTLGEEVSVWPMSVLRGDVAHISVGRRSNIQDLSMLHVTRAGGNAPQGFPLIIGEEVTVGHHATLHGCRIGNRVLVGMGSIILDGAQIEDEVIIGAGSLVPPRKILAGGFLYLGNPVRQIRPLTVQEKAFLAESADNYCRLARDYAG